MPALRETIKVVILRVPNSARVLPLEKALKVSDKFDFVQFEAVMYDKSMTQFTPNFRKQKVLYRRFLSNGETGCTISHQVIQKEYSIQGKPVVILEDAVLSLLPWKSAFVKTDLAADLSIIPLIGKSPLTVGYVITPKAMVSISTINSDFSYLPDWPPTETNFYVTSKGVINHGDDQTVSLIDQTGRVKTGKAHKMLMLTCVPYLMNKKMFLNFTEYFRFAIMPTFTWRIDNWRNR